MYHYNKGVVYSLGYKRRLKNCVEIYNFKSYNNTAVLFSVMFYGKHVSLTYLNFLQLLFGVDKHMIILGGLI